MRPGEKPPVLPPALVVRIDRVDWDFGDGQTDAATTPGKPYDAKNDPGRPSIAPTTTGTPTSTPER